MASLNRTARTARAWLALALIAGLVLALVAGLVYSVVATASPESGSPTHVDEGSR